MNKSIRNLFFASLCLAPILALGQSAGDYRTIASGDWSTLATWETYDGLSWVAPISAPDVNAGIISIEATHSVALTANVIVDQLVIQNGGVLTINTGVTMEIEDGTGTDLNSQGLMTVNGILQKNQGAVITSTVASLDFPAGGTYRHNNTTTLGNIPTATWHPQSNCEVIGYTSFSGSPGFGNNFWQNFGNFTWNCPNQTGNINFAGYLENVLGSFTLVTTGTGELRLCGATSPVLTIGQDFIQQGGDFVTSNGTGLPTINIGGNFTQTGGTFGSNGSGITTLQFVKSGTQQVLIAPGIVHFGNINYAVKNSGGFGPSLIEFMDASTVFQNATLTADFTMEPNTGLIIRHADGIALAGNTGCVQTGGIRTFVADGSYTYAGNTAQITGTGLPSLLTGTLIIDNSTALAAGGVTLTQPTVISGASAVFSLSLGKCITSIANILSVGETVTLNGGSNASFVEGPLQRFTNSTLEWAFPVGEDIYYKPVSVLPAVASIENFVVAAHHQLPPNHLNLTNAPTLCSISNVEYWDIVGSVPAQLQLMWHGYSNVDETNTCALTVAHYDGTTGLWESKGASGIDTNLDIILSAGYNGNYNTAYHTFGFICPITSSASVVNVSCLGGNNGALSATISGGSAPYTLSWNTGASTANISGLTAGNYTLYIQDANGCLDTLSTAVGSPTALSASAIINQQVTCPGGNDGSASITAGGGSGTYLYSWTPIYFNTATVNTLSANTYTVYVKDAADSTCMTNTSVTLTQPLVVVDAVNDNADICLGASNVVIAVLNNDTGSINASSVQTVTTPPASQGTVTVNANGTLTFTPAPTFSGTTSFNYQVLSPSGCSDVATVFINQISTPTPTLSASGPTTFCQGGNVTLSSNIATGLVWNPGGQTTQSIIVSQSGNYTVTSTGTNGCSATSLPLTVTVNSIPSTPTISPSGNVSICQGGAVTLTSSATTNNTWSPGGQTTPSISVNTAGSYTVTVTQNGCTATSAPVNISVNAAPVLPTISASGPTTFCQGGSVVLTTNGISGIAWNPGGQTTQSITVTQGGTYTVTAVTASGCTATSNPITVTVNPVPATPVISASGPAVFCQGGSVNLSSSVSSNIVWTPGGATTPSISVNQNGTYTVTATNANGCTATSQPLTVTVNPTPPVPFITANGPTAFCQGGSVTLSSSSAAGNTWNTSVTTQSISVSTPGNYSVTVTDINGCTATSAPTTVTVFPQPATPIIFASGPLTFCEGGSVVLSSSSSTDNLWSTGETTQNITVDTTGNYFVTVSNTGGCSAVSSAVTVTLNPNPAPPVITVAGPNPFCAGGSTTLISNLSSGIVWSNGLTNDTLVTTQSGTFTLTYTDNNGCIATSAAVSVTALPQIVLTVNNVQNADCGATNGTATANVIGGSGSFAYNWDSNPVQTTATATNLGPGVYTLTVTDLQNPTCFVSQLVTIGGGIVPSVSTSPSGIIAICPNKPVPVSVTGGSSYVWLKDGVPFGTGPIQLIGQTGNYQVIGFNTANCSDTSAILTVGLSEEPKVNIFALTQTEVCPEQQVTLLASANTGDYMWFKNDEPIIGAATDTITVSQSGFYNVVVSNNCGADTSAYIEVFVHPKPIAGFVYNPMPAMVNDTVIFTDQSLHGATWTWDFGDGVGTSLLQNPVYIYNDTGVYYVHVLIKDDIGCSDTVTQPVVIEGNATVESDFIPNVFTPNGDNIYDTWEVNYGDYTMERTEVYDRWGNLMFRTREKGIGWDGTTRAGGKAVEGVYYYVIRLKNYQNRPIVKKGTITLMR